MGQFREKTNQNLVIILGKTSPINWLSPWLSHINRHWVPFKTKQAQSSNFRAEVLARRQSFHAPTPPKLPNAKLRPFFFLSSFLAHSQTLHVPHHSRAPGFESCRGNGIRNLQYTGVKVFVGSTVSSKCSDIQPGSGRVLKHFEATSIPINTWSL